MLLQTTKNVLFSVGENQFEQVAPLPSLAVQRPNDQRPVFTYFFLCCNITRVKTLELLGQAVSGDGTVMKLIRRSDEYIILANGKSLMSSRMHGSEEALAHLACRLARKLPRPRVLVGGLGMGFTLRAALAACLHDHAELRKAAARALEWTGEAEIRAT